MALSRNPANSAVVFLVAAWLAAGCQVPSPAPESSKTGQTTQSNPDSNPSGAPEAAAKRETSQAKVAEPAKSGSENPRRIYQLGDLKTGKVTIDGKAIRVWVMDTVSKQEEGLMFVTADEIADDQGMLFVFPDAEPRSFWMQNTLIPLDIMYFSAAGKLLNIAHGKALDTSSLPSKGAAQYVLEMKAGSGAKLEFRTGSEMKMPADLKAAQ